MGSPLQAPQNINHEQPGTSREANIQRVALCLSLSLSLSQNGLTFKYRVGLRQHHELLQLARLEAMTLMELPHLRKVGTFSGRLKQLQVLEIEDCDELEDVQGLGLLPNLKALSCSQDLLCEEPRMFRESLVALSLTNVKKARPNLRDMSALEALYLNYERCTSVMGIGHGLAGRLKVMSLIGKVKKIGDIGQLPNLEKILIYCCDGLKEIEWSSFHGLTNLKEIEIYNCYDLKYVKGDSSGLAPTLQSVVIDKCRNLKEAKCRNIEVVVDPKCGVRLVSLKEGLVDGCFSLEVKL